MVHPFSIDLHSWPYRPQPWSVLLLSRFRPLTCGKSPGTVVPNPAASLAWSWRNFTVNEREKSSFQQLYVQRYTTEVKWHNSPLLRMSLIKGAIYSHGDRHLIQVAVLTHLVNHGSQTSATELSCTTSDHTTHFLYQYAVITSGASEAQVLQNWADLSHGQPISVGKQEFSGRYCTITHCSGGS